MSSTKDRVISSIRQDLGKIVASTQPPPSASQNPTPEPINPTPIPIKPPETVSTVDRERMAFDLINTERVKAGLSPTLWDDRLYQLSKSHTQEMANRKELFHSPIGSDIGEDAWGGQGYSRYSGSALAEVIVNSWMSSPLHKAWILHAPIKHSVVSIVSDSTGQYASWTFWTSEAGEGPALIRRAYNLWQSETGGNIPWLTWLYDIKGYPNNKEFLKELGIE